MASSIWFGPVSLLPPQHPVATFFPWPAMFEIAAEFIGGLIKAFGDYEKAAWKSRTAGGRSSSFDPLSKGDYNGQTDRRRKAQLFKGTVVRGGDAGSLILPFEADVTPPEDLMREHGVLDRLLF